jgi:flagellar biosynthesis protein FlhA
LDAGALPITRTSGLTAAQQSFGAHDRARRSVMTDVTAGTQKFGLPGLGEIGLILKRGDLALAIGVLLILVVLILPLPPMLLDVALAVSIILSVLILMTALFIQTPLEFSAFPTVLLISTMLRLALNLASTRLILAHGHEGTAAAGHVIEAFGNFVMSGNFVIGMIVFTILIIVNFVVITKGSGRIAEVAARFHLDAMPGKQMAIDADLSAGMINEDEARRRRRQIEDESGFFGAMDGASKFVRGDAIAGLLVVFINIIGGMIIGIAQQGMPFADAARIAAHGRRRPGHPDPGADRLDRRRPAGHQGRGGRRRRPGAGEAALRLSQGARHVGSSDAGDGGTAGDSLDSFPASGRRRSCPRLVGR